MAKEIKTKEFVRNVKQRMTSNIKSKIKQVVIRTKDKISTKVEEQFKTNNKKQGTDNPKNYATDKVSETAQKAVGNAAADTRKAVNTAKNVVKKQINNKREKNKLEQEINDEVTKNQPETTDNLAEKDATQPEVKKDEKQIKTNDRSNPQPKTDTVKENDKPDIKKSNNTKQIERKKVKQKKSDTKKNAPKQREYAEPKTRGKQDIKSSKDTDRKIKQLNSDVKKIRETKKSADNAKKTIKTAENTAKNTERTVEATRKTAEATAKASKEAARIAEKTAKATAKTAKAVGKAIVEAGKAMAAGIKEIGAAIAAGGPVAVVIVVICLIAVIGGTCFGIFLSNDESTGTEQTMSKTISQLTSEYYNSITALKSQYVYDDIEIRGDTTINWKDVLTIYAVKYTNSSDGFEVATLNDVKINKLKEIMKDMNPCTGVVVSKVTPVIKEEKDADGNVTLHATFETKKILVITATHISASSEAIILNFNDEQKSQVTELTSSAYDALWNDLISSSGEILIPGGSYVGTNIFTWPLSVQGSITSKFGVRTDPISGEVKSHGGTDIAAPTGTPILAAADGTVVIASYNEGGYGFYVKIKHNNTFSTLYGHCSVLNVSTGQTVKQGQKIAEVGSTGYSTGPHCHFEVIQNGVRVDAMKFFK